MAKKFRIKRSDISAWRYPGRSTLGSAPDWFKFGVQAGLVVREEDMAWFYAHGTRVNVLNGDWIVWNPTMVMAFDNHEFNRIFEEVPDGEEI